MTICGSRRGDTKDATSISRSNGTFFFQRHSIGRFEGTRSAGGDIIVTFRCRHFSSDQTDFSGQ